MGVKILQWLTSSRVHYLSSCTYTMPAHRIGIDILHVPRIVALVRRRGAFNLASRILSPVELDSFRALANPFHKQDNRCMGTMDEIVAARFLGVRCGLISSIKAQLNWIHRWAVKEAAYKALYPLRPTWKDLTYKSFDKKTRSKPQLVCQTAAGTLLDVSVSHDGEYIVASVLAESVSSGETCHSS